MQPKDLCITIRLPNYVVFRQLLCVCVLRSVLMLAYKLDIVFPARTMGQFDVHLHCVLIRFE